MSVLKFFVTVAILVSRALAVQSAFKAEGDDVAIGSNWQVLGPFQSGTREQQWGADPLEAYGGFPNIAFDSNQQFPSSLNGTVYFRTLTASPLIVKNDMHGRNIPVSFPDVDWTMLEKVFGWSALQFQAWIRGYIHIPKDGRYGLWIGNAVEFYLDGIYYDAGNLYDADVFRFNRGGLFLELSAGTHVLEIRVINDIRAFGGQIPPKVDVQVALRKVKEGLVVADYDSHGGWVVPTVINMTRKDKWRGDACIAGEWASFSLRNEGKEWIYITSLRLNNVYPIRQGTLTSG
jgi:hypothetical protein